MSTCPACGKSIGLGQPKTTTLTGRTVHERCGDSLIAASAGAATSPASPVADGIATEGWFQRLRRNRKRK